MIHLPSHSARADDDERLPPEGLHERDLLVEQHLRLVVRGVLLRLEEKVSQFAIIISSSKLPS